jgi:hypothetical protein
MEKLTLEKFLERTKELPLDVRMGIVDTDFLTAIRNIQRDNQLHIDQGAALEDLTFKVILGDITDEEYLQDLQRDLSIDQAFAYKIANSVNENILEPIRTEIKKLQEETEILNSVPTAAEIAALPEEPAEPEHLNAADVLAGIEDPDPSIPVQHETIIPNVPTAPKPAAVTATPPVPTPVTAPVVPVTPAQPAQATVLPPVAPSKTPTVKIAEALNLKLEQPVSTKPAQIEHSIDPYKEPIE